MNEKFNEKYAWIIFQELTASRFKVASILRHQGDANSSQPVFEIKCKTINVKSNLIMKRKLIH